MKKKVPFFTTAEGRAKYMAAYGAMFSMWKVPYDSLDVKTRCCKKNVIYQGRIFFARHWFLRLEIGTSGCTAFP